MSSNYAAGDFTRPRAPLRVEKVEPGSSASRVRSWLLTYPRAIPLAIFLAIVAITLLSVYSIESNTRARQDAQMREYAKEVSSALEQRGNSFSVFLRSTAALFSNVGEVDADLFGQFVSELRINLDNKGVEGIGWIEVLPRARESEYVQRMREERPDFPGVRAQSAGDLFRIAPVTYMAPETVRNRRAIGFDMYSDKVAAAAMEEAKRRVRPTATGRMLIAEDATRTTTGFLVFMPVYRDVDGPTDDVSLQGFVYAPFNADRFLDAAVEGSNLSRFGFENLGMRLFDGDAENDNLIAERELADEVTVSIEETVNIGNREFLLIVESDDPRLLAPLSMVTLLFGLALASLLMLLARLLTQQAFEDRQRISFFEEQNSIRNSLTRELNHRVKNTLANVLSILSLTRRRAHDLDDFADSLEGRIRSLSATHDLLTRTEWSTTPIRAVVDAELQHFRKEEDPRVSTEGPQLELAPNDALSFGLALHELATNAAKYGSLSNSTGRVKIEWTLIDDQLAEVEWREIGGPTVPEHRPRGFGTELIQKIVAHELKHPVDLEFEPEGVRCVLRVPVRQRSEFQIRAKENAEA